MFQRDRATVLGVDLDIRNLPSLRLARFAFYVHQARRRMRIDRDSETVQAEANAVAASLQISLFARPATKKGAVLPGSRGGRKTLAFRR